MPNNECNNWHWSLYVMRNNIGSAERRRGRKNQWCQQGGRGGRPTLPYPFSSSSLFRLLPCSSYTSVVEREGGISRWVDEGLTTVWVSEYGGRQKGKYPNRDKRCEQDAKGSERVKEKEKISTPTKNLLEVRTVLVSGIGWTQLPQLPCTLDMEVWTSVVLLSETGSFLIINSLFVRMNL